MISDILSSYYTSPESALRAVYDRIQSELHIDRNHGLAQRVLSLRNMIVDTDFHGCRRYFDHIVKKIYFCTKGLFI